EYLGPLPAGELIRDGTRNHPRLAVRLMADAPDPEVISGAMDAGARGGLPHDRTLCDLATSATQAAARARTPRRLVQEASDHVTGSGRRGSILTFSGAKGGIGTTTQVVQLARAAARAGRSISLVDLDLQKGDIPGYLDLNHRRSIVDLVQA